MYYQKIKNNIKRTGRYPALIVRPRNGRYQIIDGHTRAAILKELGYQVARCEIWDVDDKETKILLATLNRLRGVDDTKKRAVLLAEIRKDFDEESFTYLVPESNRAIEGLIKLNEKEILSLDDERGLIEQKLTESGVDPEQAGLMANLHKAPGFKPVFKFVFNDESEYNKVKKFFGGVATVDKLVELIDFYEKQNKKET